MMMSAQSCCSICTLTGWDDKDLLIGGKGDDMFIGGGGDDLMFGRAGDDTFQRRQPSRT